MEKFFTCKNCQFKNPDFSLYCQRCGTRLEIPFFKRNHGKNTNWALAGLGQKGSSLAPLAGMAIDSYGKEFQNHTRQTFPKITITPNANGIWYCPLCGDQNTDKLCKGCGFPS